MTFEEKWNHVVRRLFVFFTREGVFNFSLLLLSPLGLARDGGLPVSSGEPTPKGKQGMEIYLFHRESLPQT